jgi:hypothetical protein
MPFVADPVLVTGTGLDPAIAVLRAARMLLPVREASQNTGRFVDAIIRSAGGTPPEAWCASTLYYVGSHLLGPRWPLPKTRSCDVLLEFARTRFVLRPDPAPGYVFLCLRSDTDAYHTGFVETLAPTFGSRAFNTLEGNSNDDGSANGDGFYALTRGEDKDPRTGKPDPTRYAFIAWAELPAP